MYTLGSLILMAILLGAVMPVFNTLTHTLKLDKIIKSIPVLGAHVTIAVSGVDGGHTVDFRESADFQAWRALVSEHFAAPPQVEHTVLAVQGF